MGVIKRRRIRQVLMYGWKDAGEISKYPDVNKSRLSIFLDILKCFRQYYLFSNQYKTNKIWDNDNKESLCKALGKANLQRDNFFNIYYDNWKFLNKFSSLRWEETSIRWEKRNKAYANHYGLGENAIVQYGVTLICEHFSIGKIICGRNVLFARDVDIDYTGGITIENDVKISEGVKILTHNHNLDFIQRDDAGHGLIKTPLIIRDNVGIGARAVIMPGVNEIGRRAMISTSAVVKRQVPPYAIVMGNPARVVGFRYPPAVTAEFEEENYPENERIPLEVLEDNYKKYYLSKLSEIKSYLG